MKPGSRFAHLLVPTDLDACARRALDVAIDLASKYDARLTLLHVYYVPRHGYAAHLLDDSFVASIAAAARQSVDAVVEEARRTYPRIEGAVVAGVPHEQIVTFAHAHAVDLIVMGTKGRRGLERLLLGSVADRVLRLSDVPVALVPSPAE